MTDDIAEMAASLRELDPDTPVSLPRVSRVVGWAPDAQTRAIQAGVVEPLSDPAPAGRRGYMVSRDEALTILAAAVLALAAGVAVVVMIRAIKATGLDPGQLLPA